MVGRYFNLKLLLACAGRKPLGARVTTSFALRLQLVILPIGELSVTLTDSTGLEAGWAVEAQQVLLTRCRALERRAACLRLAAAR